MTHDRPQRRHDLDWLRVAACYLLLLFHVGMVFNPAPFYHVRNDELSIVFLVLCGFIGLWHMPLFFLLAGWSAFASLRKRGGGRFLRERGRKLAVPLILGCVVLAPPIKYLELRSGLDLSHRGLRVSEALQESFRTVVPSGLPVAERFDESFLEFLPSFYTDVDRFSWSHLWFLAYLLALTVLLLPLFLALVRRRVAHPGKECLRLWVYAPLAPLIAIQLLLRERFPGPYNLYSDWAHLAFYGTFLISGFLLARHPELESAVRRERRRALGVALSTMLVLLAAVLGVAPAGKLLLVGAAVAGWCFVVALLGFADVALRSRALGLAYLGDSAFPVYLLHQPVIVVLGYALVPLPLGIAAKFAILLIGSTTVTLGLYHWLVRSSSGLRRLMGLGARRTTLAHVPSGRSIAPVLREPA